MVQFLYMRKQKYVPYLCMCAHTTASVTHLLYTSPNMHACIDCLFDSMHREYNIALTLPFSILAHQFSLFFSKKKTPSISYKNLLMRLVYTNPSREGMFYLMWRPTDSRKRECDHCWMKVNHCLSTPSNLPVRPSYWLFRVATTPLHISYWLEDLHLIMIILKLL